ncbi:MAG: hypothetical protein JWM14_1887 [Chitinophagaceae bacterium]|nr:hypothetical protein [Chitinophagaceae bacterium]
MRTGSILFFIFLSQGFLFAQTVRVGGTIKDKEHFPVTGALVEWADNPAYHAITDSLGLFVLHIPSVKDEYRLTIKAFGFSSREITIPATDANKNIEYNLAPDGRTNITVEVEGNKVKGERERLNAGGIYLDPKTPQNFVSAFGDFNKVISSIGMGVSSNNELSSTYNVRGGNYDENLVYVNNMQIYRPFLAKTGQQEGLSFINPDLVEKISFYAGGWQPRYGDKLSSVLDVKYKHPTQFKASASLGLLGATLHAENASKNKRWSYAFGARHKRAGYLLNSLPTKGEYKPRFYDVQGIVNYNFKTTKDAEGINNHSISLIYSWAYNDYRFEPSTRETKFGTLSQPKTFSVAYDGKERMEYNTGQIGLMHYLRLSPKLRIETVGYLVKSVEREYRDVMAAYRLCDTDPDPNNQSFNQCLFVTGLGSDYNYSRNKLESSIGSVGERAYYHWNDQNDIEMGLIFTSENIQDKLYEYSIQDSADYITGSTFVSSQANLKSHRLEYYVQHSYHTKDSLHYVTYGARLNYWSLNNQFLVSPRISYAFKPKWKRDMVFRLATGVYQQPPFYRELRNQQGVVNTSLQAQRSWHVIGGMDYNLKLWNRPFKFITEAYFKLLDKVVPYDVENIRLRYYGQNSAQAYVTGVDFRLSGEFVKGAESWFSLGFLQTKEKVDGDPRGYIRRPTDQLINASIFFRDHIPNNPSLQVYLTLSYLSGFPFGPKDRPDLRASFASPAYRRVDIGFAKLVSYSDKRIEKKKLFESIWITAEVLNLLGVSNTISYDWIKDGNGFQYAIPNTLSSRFLNIKITVRY